MEFMIKIKLKMSNLVAESAPFSCIQIHDGDDYLNSGDSNMLSDWRNSA